MNKKNVILSNLNQYLKCLRLNLIKKLSVSLLVLFGSSAFAAGPYTYNAAGDEVTDTVTNLVWRRCLEGQTWSGGTCTGTPIKLIHQTALTYAATKPGWRMPNVKELASLLSFEFANPIMDKTAFPVANGYVWTSTPKVPALTGDTSNQAWSVSFFLGRVELIDRPVELQIRLVR
jgi:Protein of unknown function (DUF1566)